jgi:transitional endoplasmic reticulum ATPase
LHAILSRANSHFHLPRGAYALALAPLHLLARFPSVTVSASPLAGRAGRVLRAAPLAVEPASAVGEYLYLSPSHPALLTAAPPLLPARVLALLARGPFCAHTLLKARAALLCTLPGGGAGAGAGAVPAGASAADAALQTAAAAVTAAAAAAVAAAGAASAAATAPAPAAPTAKPLAAGAIVVSVFAAAASPISPAALSPAAPPLPLLSYAAACALPVPALGARLARAGLLREWGGLDPALALPLAGSQSAAAAPVAVSTVTADDAVVALARAWHSSGASASAGDAPSAVCGSAPAGALYGWLGRAASALHTADSAAAAALAAAVFGHLLLRPTGTAGTANAGVDTGASAVTGVLLSGPVGAGKTVLARALAAAAGAALATVSYASVRARALMVTPALAGAPPPLGTAAAVVPAAAAAAAAAATSASPLAMAAAARSLLLEAASRPASVAAGAATATGATAVCRRVVVLFDDAHELLPAATVASADVAQTIAALAAAAAEITAAAAAAAATAVPGAGSVRVLLLGVTDMAGRVNSAARSALFPTDIALPPPSHRARARVLAASIAAAAGPAALAPAVARAVAAHMRESDPLRPPVLAAAAAAGSTAGAGEDAQTADFFKAALEHLRGASLGDTAAAAQTACRLAAARTLAPAVAGARVAVTEGDVVAGAAHVGALLLSRSPLAEPLDPRRALGFTPLSGLAAPKQALLEALRWPLDHAALFARLGLAGAAAAGGVLLHGPAGGGKTALARAAAAEFGLTMLSLSAAGLLRAGVGESERHLRQIFRAAAASAPAVIVFDEIHSVFPAAEGDEDGDGGGALLSEFLQLLDARAAAAQPAAGGAAPGVGLVFLLATAPSPRLVHPALLRGGRLERAVYVGRPGRADCAEALLRRARPLLEAGTLGWDTTAVARLAFAAEGLSFAALHEAWARAEQRAAERAFLAHNGARSAARALARTDAPDEAEAIDTGVPTVCDVERALKKLRAPQF